MEDNLVTNIIAHVFENCVFHFGVDTQMATNSIYVNEYVQNISQLLFADDIDDAADTVVGLQRHINKGP